MKNNKFKIALSSGALVLFVVATFWVNNKSFKSTSPESADIFRNPASSFFAEIRSGTLFIERKLASEMAMVKRRGLASIGRPADSLETLRFGILEGKYALTVNGGKVSEIDFIDNPGTESRPLAVIDRAEFIKKYGALLDAASIPKRISVDIQGNKIVEKYRVKSAKEDTDLIVSFVLDETDRLFNIKTEKVSGLKIF